MKPWVSTAVPVTAGKDLIFTCESTNVGSAKFKFVFDVWIVDNAGSSSQVARVLQHPNPHDTGVFNAAEIFRSYLSADTQLCNAGVPTNEFVAQAPGAWAPASPLAQSGGNMNKQMWVMFGESYAASPTDDPFVYPNLVC